LKERSGWRSAGLGGLLLAVGCGAQAAPRGAASPAAAPSFRTIPGSASGEGTRYGRWTEAQPQYWVERLNDAELRARAIARLEQLFEDAYTRGNASLSDPGVLAVIDVTVEPLTRTYVQRFEKLGWKERVTLIKLLASYRDARSEPALRMAFEQSARGRFTAKEDRDLKWAAQANGQLRLESLAMPMLKAFIGFQASTPAGAFAYRDLNQAMLAVADPRWARPLVALLRVDMVPPRSDRDQALIDPFRNQVFWQVTASQVLGLLGDAQAVAPLLEVMLDPAKAELQSSALLALIKLGRPSVDAAARLLAGKDETQRSVAALVLGASGRPDAAAPILQALEAEKSPTQRALLARALSNLPATDITKLAFKSVYDSLELDVLLTPGTSALEQLTEAAGKFRDPAAVDWLLARAARARGPSDKLRAFRQAVVSTVLKLARPAQLPLVERAVDKYAAALERRAALDVKSLLKDCGESVACYLDAIQKPENQGHSSQLIGIKAGYMIGVLGDPAARDALVAALDRIDNPAVRFAAGETIDHLTPNGSPEVSAQLDALIARNATSADPAKVAGDAYLKQVTSRIASRSR
jgi:hypothetical protein